MEFKYLKFKLYPTLNSYLDSERSLATEYRRDVNGKRIEDPNTRTVTNSKRGVLLISIHIYVQT